MSNEFELPEFMSDEEPKKDSFFEGSNPHAPTEGIVFVFQSQEAPVLPSGESEPQKFQSLTPEELIGVYITTNAMMNILIDKGIVSRRELSEKVAEIKKAYLDSKK